MTTARIEEFLRARADALSPKSLNILRGALHTIFGKAIKRGMCSGPNPAACVDRRKVPRRVFETLRAEEVTPLLASLAPEWQPLFAAAIWTGMRKGELLGLLKSDVDLAGAAGGRRPARRRRRSGGTTSSGKQKQTPGE